MTCKNCGCPKEFHLYDNFELAYRCAQFIPVETKISQSQLTSAYEDSLIREANKCRAIAWDEFGL